MTRDIDLTSQKWLSLIFEGKNKDYGAYVLRDESSNRHFKALIIVTSIGLLSVFLPKLVGAVMPAPPEVMVTTVVDLSDLVMDQDIPEENQIPEIEMPPPPLLMETIQFTPPVITQDDNVREEDLMRSQQELTDNQVEISIANVEGVREGGVNIADIASHQVVVQEEKKEPQIFSHVEVMPQFPGGDTELMRWLNSNMRYPTIAAEQGIQGRVTLRFVVTPDGSIGNVEILKSLDPSCDKEAVRVVKSMPKWAPGKQNGNPVYVWYNLPVTFRLQN